MSDVELGAAFADEEVVALYRNRPPYPAEVFEILARLIVEPRAVLDAGCGTGALTRGLARIASRVDAVDPSAAMLATARRLGRGDQDAPIRWQHAEAEDAALAGPYGLITCGASLHWMRQGIVLPRFRDALAPRARLAIVDTEAQRAEDDVRGDVLTVITRYSALHVETPQLIEGLVADGRFVLEGLERTAPVPFQQTVDEYLGFLGSTSSLSRVSLGPRAKDFDRDLRAVFARHHVSHTACDVVGLVAWGRPA